MADLRLIAVCALAACSSADAQPPATSGIKPPSGWQAQPQIAKAAKDAFGKSKNVDGVEAFGEPAMGCYMLWMSLRGSGSAKDVAEELVKGLVPDPKAKRKLEITDVVKPTAEEGVLSLAFASPPYKGRLRARLGKGKIVTLACFSSQREPAACESTCTTVLATAGAP